MRCRAGCGACCIAPSISSPIPGMPHGKPAGARCVQLSDEHLCRIFDLPERPQVCINFSAASDTCGVTRAEGIAILAQLEELTR